MQVKSRNRPRGLAGVPWLPTASVELDSGTKWLSLAGPMGGAPLTGLAGKKVQIRFRFDSLDSIFNEGPGWFVDDLEFAVVGP